MAAILIISAKLAAMDLLKIKIFCNEDHNFIISVHDVHLVTQIIL